jgi:D-lactate dehydrogenase (cytochrome)
MSLAGRKEKSMTDTQTTTSEAARSHAAGCAGLPGALAEELRATLGQRFSVARAVREQHGLGESYHAVVPPDAVCFAESTEEVAAIVKACARHKTPIIPFGGGTSLEGHVSAPFGGVSVDVSRMDQVLEVRPGDMDVTVQAGVTRQQLNSHLRDTGLFFPVDPGAECTLGGMASTRASGTNAVRYGTMRENVVRLTVVLSNGDVIRTGSRARKSAAGYDLTRLFVGSEGTLGIITEVTLRVYPIPEATSVAICPFPDLASAAEVVTAVIQMGIPISRIEFLDEYAIRATNRHSGTAYRETPTLFFEFTGSELNVTEQASQVKDICAEFGVTEFEWAVEPEARNKLWNARHNIHYAIQAMDPNAKIWSTDVCVPTAALPECINQSHEDMKSVSFFVATVGHVGDGNFHMGLVIDPQNPEEMAEATAFNERLVKRAIALDGTCTGEHGIGTGKRKFMYLEHGGGLEVMRAIKRALDPDNIMNPGKILPDT